MQCCGDQVNDILDNRVEKNVKIVSNSSLVVLPQDRSFSLDEFIHTEEAHVRQQTALMQSKNAEVESAVNDLLTLVTSYNLDPAAGAIDEREVVRLWEYYRQLMYQALLRCAQRTLESMKRRVCARSSVGFLFLDRPFFEVDVQLSVPSVRLSPSLEDIQRTLNKVSLTVLRSFKNIPDWRQSDDGTEAPSFFEEIGKDIQIVKVVLLLTGAFQGTKNQVSEYLTGFQEFDWLWKDDKEAAFRHFMRTEPGIEEYEAKLQSLMQTERKIEAISPLHVIGALSLNTRNLKSQLRKECKAWKVVYADSLHQRAIREMNALTDYISATTSKLKRPVDSIDSLRYVMEVLREVRERESAIEMDITPILDMYGMLDHYMPGGYTDQEELDKQSVLRARWTQLGDFAEEVSDGLSEVQGKHKRKLTRDVREFTSDVRRFRQDFESVGPLVRTAVVITSITACDSQGLSSYREMPPPPRCICITRIAAYCVPLLPGAGDFAV